MKVALNEKQKQLRGLSFSINIANFEAFLWVFKLTKNLLFLKSDVLNKCIVHIVYQITSAVFSVPPSKKMGTDELHMHGWFEELTSVKKSSIHFDKI